MKSYFPFIFSFFSFYYYKFFNSIKRYDLIMKRESNLIILFTPLFFFILQFIIGMFFLEFPLITNLLFLYVIIIPLNLIVVLNEQTIAWHLKWKYDTKRSELDKEEWERNRRKEKEARDRKYREESEQMKSEFEQMKDEFSKKWKSEKEKLNRERFSQSDDAFFKDDFHFNFNPSSVSFDSKLENCFKVLGLSSSSSKDEVKKAFRKLAKKYHPDAGGDVIKFKELKDSYDYILANIS